MDSIAKLKEAKQRMRTACAEAALANTPASIRVIRIRKTLSGRTYSPQVIAAPRPVTRRSLHIFLHECAHIALGHVRANTTPQFGPTLPTVGLIPAQIAIAPKPKRKPRHVEEFEAERWAFDRMREAGIPVPRKSLNRAKGYVAYKIRQAQRRGAKTIDAAALRWAKGNHELG